MLALTLRGLTVRKLRGVLTALAIFFGVAMISGTFMLTDTINHSFDRIFKNANKNVDITVKPKETVEDSHGGEPPALKASLVQRVLSTQGVAEAAGSIFDPAIAILNDKGKRIGPLGPPHFAASVVPARFNPWVYTKGRPPKTSDEVAIDNFTAKREHYELGEKVRIAGTEPARPYTITGIGRFGGNIPLGGAHIALFRLDEVQRLTGKRGKVDEILVGAKSGVSPEELKQAVAARAGPGVTVRTGQETAQSESQDVKDGFSFLSTALLVFAGVALFVGGFLIFNTFSITVAQRTREFGMLRTIGASARQVLGTVLLEAVAIGLAASLAGIAGGLGFVVMITGLFKAIGFELPTSGLVLAPRTVIVALVVGVLATVVAATVPAIRATRVTPIEALREYGFTGARGGGRRRTTVAVVLTVLGAVLLGWGLFGANSSGTSFKLFGPGLILLFIGIALLGSRMVRPIASIVGWPIERLRGVTGLLARENTLRNPSRTATTAAALMIGLALITFVAVFAAALTKSFDTALDRAFAGDLVLQNTDGQSRIPTSVAGRLHGVPGVATVSPLASADGIVKGTGKELIGGIDPSTVARVGTLDWVKGSDSTLQRLGSNGAIAESRWAGDNGIGVGDRLTVTTPTGKHVVYTVLGTVRDKVGLITKTLAIPHSTLERDFAVTADDVVLIGFDKGANFGAVRNRVDRVLSAAFPNVESRSQQQLKDDQRQQVNKLLVLIYALLALSILISLFGVVNTLILTIHERTREIGMLRAIGTSRAQVRRLIRYESVITAMIGAIMGAAIGLVLAIVAVKALSDEGFVLSIPYPLLVIMLMLAAVAGVAAAIAPARRASRVNIIEALQYE
jgi:putative ABC transport system permease protein